MNRFAVMVVIGALVAGCGESGSDEERFWACMRESKGGEDMSQISWWRRGDCQDLFDQEKARGKKMMRGK